MFEAVATHCQMLRAVGFEPVVISLQDTHTAADQVRFESVEVITLRVLGPRTPGFSPKMSQALKRAKLDLVHLHGIWLYPSFAASQWARTTGKPYIISPHGMLDPWILKRSRLKKMLARTAYEERSWRSATCFHALTEAEAQDIRIATGRRNIVVVPNSVQAASGQSNRAPTVLYLGRIHPKKNIAGLIKAWALASDVLEPIGARLQIAGWGEQDHLDALKTQIAEANVANIDYLGPVFGSIKADLIGRAKFLALPSYSEGLPVVVLEAWAAGTPTLMSEHCHLPEGFEAGAAVNCGTDADQIAKALRASLGRTEEAWRQQSHAASALASSNFSVDVIAKRWQQVYTDLIAAG